MPRPASAALLLLLCVAGGIAALCSETLRHSFINPAMRPTKTNKAAARNGFNRDRPEALRLRGGGAGEAAMVQTLNKVALAPEEEQCSLFPEHVRNAQEQLDLFEQALRKREQAEQAERCDVAMKFSKEAQRVAKTQGERNAVNDLQVKIRLARARMFVAAGNEAMAEKTVHEILKVFPDSKEAQDFLKSRGKPKLSTPLEMGGAAQTSEGFTYSEAHKVPLNEAFQPFQADSRDSAHEDDDYDEEMGGVYTKQQEVVDLRAQMSAFNKRSRSRSRSVSAGGMLAPYAGLKNEGATCYLNAVIQALFHLPALRRAVYRIPTAPCLPGEVPSVPLALQNLFWRLQSTKDPQSTTELLASFGWDSDEMMLQQDISDFCHMFFDRVEEAMKNTVSEGELDRLLGVQTEFMDVAPQVNWSQSRTDISMVTMLHGVKECKNVHESLQLQAKPEVIEGYDTETHGKQIVQRSHKFKSLPPILLLNINRIDFDPEKFEPIKLNDRFEFAETLDLSQFIVDPKEGASEGYKLCSVIVHMGTAQVGHYICYIKPAGQPDGANHWVKFDDDWVNLVSSSEAIDDNFGSDAASQAGDGINSLMMSRATLQRLRSAYMLIYVREDRWDEIMNISGMADDVPLHVRNIRDSDRYSLSQLFVVLVREAGAVFRGKGQTVEDLMASLGAAAAEQGVSMEPPSFETFVGQKPELFAPKWLAAQAHQDFVEKTKYPDISQSAKLELKIVSLSPHALGTFINSDTDLAQVDPLWLLRAEWLDMGPCAKSVQIVLFETSTTHTEAEGLGGVYVHGTEQVQRHVHGEPCVLSVYIGETARSVRTRALIKMGYALKKGDKGAVVWLPHEATEPFVLADEDEVLSDASIPNLAVLGIEVSDDQKGPLPIDFLAQNPFAAKDSGRGVRMR